MIETYVVRAYTTVPIPSTRDLTVIDLIRNAIETGGNVFFYCNVLHSMIEFKFQRLTTGATSQQIMDTVKRNLSPFNVIIARYEVNRLEDDTLSNTKDSPMKTKFQWYHGLEMFKMIGIVIGGVWAWSKLKDNKMSVYR